LATWVFALSKSAKSNGKTTTSEFAHFDFTRSRFSMFRAERISLHFLCDNSMAKAFPIPLEAPVIQTTLLFMESIFFINVKKFIEL
jgi:hypothetical protein